MSWTLRPVRLPAWTREATLVAVLYACYDATRGLHHSDVATADRHGHTLLRWDAASHLSPEHALNQLLWHVPVLAVLASYFYATLHFIVTPAVLIWLYRNHHDHYRPARTVLAVATLTALVGFWAFPAAPPRLLPGARVHDTLADVHQWGWWAGPSSAPRGLGGLANEYAAMPSLHVIWALWAGLMLVRHAQKRYLRILGCVYPISTALVVMGTGNHYFVDVVAGVVVLGFAALLTREFTRMRARLRSPRSLRRPLIRLLMVAATVVFAVVLARLLGSYLPGAGRELWHPHLGWLCVAMVAALVSMGAFSELQRTVLRVSGTRVRARRMLGLTFEANALSGSLPAGSAFATQYTFRRFRTWGASAPGAGYTILASGLLSSLAFGLLAAVAVGIVGGASADPVPAAVAATLFAAVLLILRQVRAHPAAATRLLERAVARFNLIRHRPAATGRSGVDALVTATVAIRPRGREWSGALAFAALNWAADLACLLAACRAIGMDGVTPEMAGIAYIAGMSVSGISLVPGGLGIVEAAMILTLSHEGIPHSGAIASVLLYRLCSYALMMVLGWALQLIHAHRSARSASREDPVRAELVQGRSLLTDSAGVRRRSLEHPANS